MNYELAKQLKEAGFPQDGKNIEWFDRDGDYGTYHHDIGPDEVYVPLLSELVDALPMRSKNLGTINDAHFVLRKLVSSYSKQSYWAYMEYEDTDLPVEGYSFRSPVMSAEEAVANLWLALNKKDVK